MRRFLNWFKHHTTQSAPNDAAEKKKDFSDRILALMREEKMKTKGYYANRKPSKKNRNYRSN